MHRAQLQTRFASIVLAFVTLISGFQGSAIAAENTTDSGVAPVQLTRFLIGVPKDTTFTVQSLPNPNRVIVHLPDVKIRLPNQPKNGPIGLVRSFSAGKAGPKRSLVVINVTAPVIVGKAAVGPASNGKDYYLTLDIEPLYKPAPKSSLASTEAKFGKPFGLGAVGVQPPSPRPAQTPKERLKKMTKRTIVIDPGHGGDDTGAVKNGVVEKNVVLAFSLKLRDMLLKTGRYNVLMTRSTDRFITLGGRVDFAEKHHANLFIAVHADYAQSKAHGATIYSLRGSVAKALRRSAKKRAAKVVDLSSDNFAASPAEGSDRTIVRDFLADLARNDVQMTRKRTNKFSSTVVSFMSDSTTLRHEPHKTAGFRVLKTAQFPSVLIELAYVTNKKDARNLTSEAWRQKVSSSIVTAVDDYFTSDIANLPM